MADLMLGGWTPKSPDWRGGVSAMQPSDAVAALGAASDAAFDPSSYKSQGEASPLEKFMSGLGGKKGDDSFLPPPEIKVLQAIAARAPGQMATYATGGLALDALSQMAALSGALGMQGGGAQMPMGVGQQPPASSMPATASPLYAATGALVQGPGHGTEDQIDAKLSNGEFVIPADVVSAFGKGSSDAGAEYLRTLCSQARAMHIRNMNQMPEPR